MLKPVHNWVVAGRLRLTWSELLLACVAASLLVVAILHLPASPQNAVALLLAAAAIAALLHERMTTRRVLAELAAQLDDESGSHKFDVLGTLGAEAVDHALNRMIQRTRAQASVASQNAAEAAPALGATVGSQVHVAVLSVGLRRDGAQHNAAHAARLMQAASSAMTAPAEQPRVQMQGDGTLLLIFGCNGDQPIADSLRHALATSHVLQSDPHLRFGLGVGSAQQCTLPGGATALIGAALDDAARLQRMAAAWHEYHLLCAEPVALLARCHRSQRTTLKLTNPNLPPFPVYALDLPAASVAKSA